MDLVSAVIPQKEFMLLIGNGKWLLFALAGHAVVYIFYRLYQRTTLWRLGAPLDRMGTPFYKAAIVRGLAFARLLVTQGYGHEKLMRDRYAGIMHLLIFWGASLLFLGTAFGTIEEEILFPLAEKEFLTWPIGNWYLYSSFVWDIGGIMALVGLLMAVYRRGFKGKPNAKGFLDDKIILALAIFLTLQGFSLEGLRMIVDVPHLGSEYLNSVTGTGPNWAVWSPGGFVFAFLLYELLSISSESAEGIYQVMWWLHSGTVLAH